MTLSMLNRNIQFRVVIPLKLTNIALTLILVLPGTGCDRPANDNESSFDLAKTRAGNTCWSTFAPTGGPKLKMPTRARGKEKLVGVGSGSSSDRR